MIETTTWEPLRLAQEAKQANKAKDISGTATE